MSTPDFSNIMKQAQEMQKKMEDVQKELTEMRVNGSSGAGAVKVVINGRYQVLEVSLADDLHDEGMDIVADLIKAAFNDAVARVEKMSQEKVKHLMSGMQLPGDIGGTQQ